MADNKRLELTIPEILKQFNDPALAKEITTYMAGKPVMIAYATLCAILGDCIGRTSETDAEAKYAMDLCGGIVGAVATARHNLEVAKKEAGDDQNHTPTTRLQ